jgi:tRNA (adenine57-N1/adenine58-N1)-methyltransferase
LAIGLLGAGDRVVLHDRSGRRYRATLAAGQSLSLHSGVVRHDDLIGLPEGSIVTTHQGAKLLVLRPTFAESVVDRRRSAQPIYPKDLGLVLVRADIRPGARVLEAGAGTGALTIALARAVGASGRVVAYELREEFLGSVRAAVEEQLGTGAQTVELRLGDIYEEPAEGEFDRVCLDLPEPWRALPQVAPVLRPGGILFALSPNVSQVERFANALRDAGGFGLIETYELLERGWTVRGRSLRPAHRMVAHTAFLTFARRLAGEEVFEAESEGF